MPLLSGGGHEAARISRCRGSASDGVATGRARTTTATVGDWFSAVASRLDALRARCDAFRQGLKAVGYVDRHNVAIEYRWAQGQNDRLPDMASGSRSASGAGDRCDGRCQLQHLQPRARPTRSRLWSTSGDDPIKSGLVSNLNRPGGNLTVVSFFRTLKQSESGWRCCGIWSRPRRVLAVLVNSNSPESRTRRFQTSKLQPQLSAENSLA